MTATAVMRAHTFNDQCWLQQSQLMSEYTYNKQAHKHAIKAAVAFNSGRRLPLAAPLCVGRVKRPPTLALLFQATAHVHARLLAQVSSSSHQPK